VSCGQGYSVSAEHPDDIEMKENEAYERRPPAPQEIMIEDNPSYKDWTEL